MSKQVIIFPRGQLSDKDRQRLTKVDIIAVEADDPSKVVTVVPGAPILTGDDVTMAALLAIGKDTSYNTSVKTGFAAELVRRAIENEKKQKR